MLLLSIDPGFERLGIAIIKKEKGQKETLIHSECFKTSTKIPHHERLALVQNKFLEMIHTYKPEVFATETLLFSNNVKTALLVSEVRGILLANASTNNLNIFEYNPNTIKLAITGYGKADKAQVMDMVTKLITVPEGKNSDDELDAIAIGLTCIAIERF